MLRKYVFFGHRHSFGQGRADRCRQLNEVFMFKKSCVESFLASSAKLGDIGIIVMPFNMLN